MRVGIDASNLRAGGGLTHLAELLSAAVPADHGIEQIVVWGGRATLGRLPARPWLVPIREPALDGGPAARHLWRRVTLANRARQASDVLFVPGGIYAGSFRPFVTMSRNLLPFQPREWQRYGLSWMALKMSLLGVGQSRTFRRADGIIFLNEYARDAVLARTGPVPGQLATIPHGVSAAFRTPPRPQLAPSAFGSERPFRLLYVSTIEVYKHQWHVAEAVQMLHDRGVPVTLDLVGAAYGPALARLDRVLKRQPNRALVRYLGPVGHESLPDHYRAADAFVFASSCENMPNILLEAMASGLPIACANRGPMPCVLGDAGLFFDPEAPSNIAEVIAELFQNRDRREALAEAAFLRAGGYTWARSAHDTLAFLAAVRSAGVHTALGGERTS